MVRTKTDLRKYPNCYNLITETESTGITPGAKAKPAPKANRISELPLAKIKHIIKLDPEVKLVNGKHQIRPQCVALLSALGPTWTIPLSKYFFHSS